VSYHSHLLESNEVEHQILFCGKEKSYSEDVCTLSAIHLDQTEEWKILIRQTTLIAE